MCVVARIRRQFVHHYGCGELIGTVGELSVGEGCCTFVTDSDRTFTLWLRHLAEMSEGADGTDYLRMARERGWKGQ